MENKIDFYVYGYQKLFEVGGKSVYLTTTHVCLAIVFAILVIFAIVMNRKIAKADPTKPPKGILNVMEMLVEMLDNLVHDNMGKTLAPKFQNYIGVIFMVILSCNLAGLFGLRPPTADYGVTLPLGLITFFIIQYEGIKMAEVGKAQRFI